MSHSPSQRSSAPVLYDKGENPPQKILARIKEEGTHTVIDKIIVALKMDSLINDAIKGVILILVILVQIVGPQIKQKLEESKNK